MTDLSPAQQAAQDAARKKGRFGEQGHADPGTNLLGDTETPQFVYNGNHSDNEQARPWFDAYTAIHEELTAADKYAYDDRFTGRIPGIAGSPKENTAIYMLQELRRLDEMHANIDSFLADGGVPVEEADLPEGKEVRGTLANYGSYVGGTGWSVRPDVRVRRVRGQIQFKLPRERSPRAFSGGHTLFKPDGGK